MGANSAAAAIETAALESVGPNDALIVPSAMQALRLRHFSDGRFANLFIASSRQQHPAYVPPEASWVDLYNGRRNPGEFFTETAADRLGEFTTVWCLPEQSVNDRPPGLGPDYSLKATVVLLPGGQFGAEASAHLGQWIRVSDNTLPS